MDFGLYEEWNDVEPFCGERIMIVDDNEMSLEVMQVLLEDRGMKVDAFISGEEALEQYQRMPCGTYRLVLLDLNLIGMNGCVVAKKIRNMGRSDSRNIPIFALSAEIISESRRCALDSGMNGYIEKPVNYRELFDLFHTIFEKQSGEGAGS